MILRSIVILVAMAAGTALALDHPRLPHRVLHEISPAQLEATCPRGALASVEFDTAPRRIPFRDTPTPAQGRR